MKQSGVGGFFLMELMVGLCLVLLLIVCAVMSLSFFDRIMVRSELEKLNAVCRYMQYCAIVGNEQKELLFDVEHNSYFFDNQKQILVRGMSFGCMNGVKGPPGSAHHTINKSITFPGNRI